MNIKKIPTGIKIPNDIYAIIEIPQNYSPIKYEMNQKFSELFVDRLINTPIFYPCNYGYINKTRSKDGDELDILVPTPYPLHPKSIIRCRPIGTLIMEDEGGKDEKIIAVPHEKITTIYKKVLNIQDLPKLLKNQIYFFFENYKKLDKTKWVKIIGWENKKKAYNLIIEAKEKYNKKL